eukprot:CAMPEP_0198737654 /NCGR_PEP_ID=MMETSP1475-20131203/67978_1 /TAXON_ID= ORGANISM="Unidentified sp., Strain CCMP1999" /NCGR_SAMPLE_ID=MMETSP1475 /ASSEMBLY_ACC=CAM_ASM_001111 /LENGTH=467 /DNA_ID=CAMNT_0044501523 /DNA_START=1746 /DNA_END=3146 /DNA_ORIENTATION=-
MDSAYAVNDRVEATDGNRGWVRYVGKLEGSKSARWIGVEWDDATRGKHDGEYLGKRYFTCASEGAPATFVKDKVLLPRRTLGEAIQKRYGKNDESMAKEVVSTEAVSLGDLEVCSVNKMLVCKIDGSDVRASPKLTDLDLSDNLMSNWDQVMEGVALLPRLSALNLTGNLLVVNPNPTKLPCVNSLILGAMRLNDEHVNAILQSFPCLEELSLFRNKVESLQAFVGALPTSLQKLDLSYNRISSWKQVSSLSQLSQLEQLTLSHNSIETVTTPTEDADWTSLSELTLSGNPIAQWTSVTALAQFSSLKSLRLTDSRLVIGDGDSPRSGIIVRLPNLKILNGSVVSADERLDAQNRFLETLRKAVKTDAVLAEEFQAHPNDITRFVDRDFSACLSRLSVKTISDDSIEVSLMFGDRNVRKKLPRSMEIRKLRRLCSNLLKTGSNPSLTVTTGTDVVESVPLEDDFRTL